MTTKDFLVSGKEFKLLRDTSRDLLQTDPMPENLAPYYKSREYISHTDSRKGILALFYQLVKRHMIRRKIKMFDKYAGEDKSLLDIGAGTGDLLAAAKKEGYEVYGTEPNKDAREKARNKGVALKESISFQRKFKLISLWHVLEHLPDPDVAVQNIKSHLDDDGTLFVAVPNFNSYDAKYYREFWAAYDVPRHLWHFSRNALNDLFQKHQMKVIDIRPMPFDAFYVSLLSEKYRTGKNRFLNAFAVGALSNLKAKSSGEYSSLIYIAQKA